MDGMLSQEEINALLNGGADTAPVTTETLTDEEKDAIGEISNISMGTAATTLSTLVNQKVVITTPVVTYGRWSEIADAYDRPCVFIQISYREGLNGNNVLILRENDVKIITDLMMGGDGTSTADELSELHLSAISEAMNQMMGSASTSLSSIIEKKVDISPPSAVLLDLNDTIEEEMSDFLRGEFIIVTFRMEIGDLVDSEIKQLYPFEFARSLYQKFNKPEEVPIPEAAPAVKSSQPSAQPMMDNSQMMGQPMMDNSQMMGQPMMDPSQMMGQPMMNPSQMMGQPMMDPSQMMGQPMMMNPSQMMSQPMMNMNVQPVKFQPFIPAMNSVTQQENIELIMDVPLEVSVELGRTSKSIKEILDFVPGTIIELNRLAGEPIDILVNGKFVAKGEVVVIEESFGIRLTEITKGAL